MTCQDCIHFKKDKDHYAEWDDYICEHSSYGPYYYTAECPINEFCDNKFENNDGSYYDGHWHCHRCGKIVEVAGLCYECEKWLMDNPIDESWESVSK